MRDKQRATDPDEYRWDGYLFLLSDTRRQDLAKRLWEWRPEMATASRTGPFAGEKLNGLEVYWLVICALAGPEGDTTEAELSLVMPRGDLGRVAHLCLNDADLRGALLADAYLSGADMRHVDLAGAIIPNADLYAVDLREANLTGAILGFSRLNWAVLAGANLRHADLSGAHLRGTDLRGANLNAADLSGAICDDTHLEGADLTNCGIYRVAPWGVEVDETTEQTNLRIRPWYGVDIMVDTLEVAQLVSLVLQIEEHRHVIDSISGRWVLILGYFTKDDTPALEALQDALRRRAYLPVTFNVAKVGDRKITETIATLARLARFVIADLTEAKRIPQELISIAPIWPLVALQPTILETVEQPTGFQELKRYPWVLDTYRYPSLEQVAATPESIIESAERLALELPKINR